MIKTEAQYEATLAEVERLVGLDPTPGTPDGDRLELLAHLVQAYESEHFPTALPDPLEAIRFRMEQQGLTQRDLVPYFGSRSKVSEVLSGKRALTLSMIRAIHSGLAIPAHVLLRESGASLPQDEPGIQWERFPVFEMAKRGWFETPSDDPRGHAEELMRGFFSPLDGQQLGAFYRRTISQRTLRTMDDHAVIAWTARVLILATRVRDLRPYVAGTVDEGFLREVARLSWFERGPLLARELLAKRGIALVTERHLPRTYIDGAAMLSRDGRPVIGLSLRHDRIDSFWFCLVHELSHVALHLNSADTCFVDDLEAITEDRREREADTLATEALIPQAEWRRSRAALQRTPEAIEEFANQVRVHPAVIAGFIRHSSRNYRILSQMVIASVSTLFEDTSTK
jgi:HTH-type transcriptional regulator/antitoxin HigA